MRGRPYLDLGRRQTDGGAHWPRQPWTRLGRWRPDRLDEAAKHHHVGRLQPRLQRPPDKDTRMFGAVSPAQGPPAPNYRALEERVEQTRHHLPGLIR